MSGAALANYDADTPDSASKAQHFVDAALANAINRTLLERLQAVGLPDCWLVAGCLFQTIWNQHCGRPAAVGIKDYDIFYCDPTDTSWEAEDRAIKRVRAAVSDLGIVFDLKNQARVHLWYEQRFGVPCPPLTCTRDGIDRFLVAGTCIGLSLMHFSSDAGSDSAEPAGQLYAPFGLDDCLAGVLRPNPLNADQTAAFRAKADSYRHRWPHLTVRPEVAPPPLTRQTQRVRLAPARALPTLQAPHPVRADAKR